MLIDLSTCRSNCLYVPRGLYVFLVLAKSFPYAFYPPFVVWIISSLFCGIRKTSKEEQISSYVDGVRRCQSVVKDSAKYRVLNSAFMHDAFLPLPLHLLVLVLLHLPSSTLLIAYTDTSTVSLHSIIHILVIFYHNLLTT